jgi:hypothetical protein
VHSPKKKKEKKISISTDKINCFHNTQTCVCVHEDRHSETVNISRQNNLMHISGRKTI